MFDFEEHKRAINEAQDQMARAFGRRPEGMDHRLIVDHDLLSQHPPGSTEWQKTLGYLGLDALQANDARLPAPLRALLSAANAAEEPAMWLMAVPLVLMLMSAPIVAVVLGISALEMLLPMLFLIILVGIGAGGVLHRVVRQSGLISAPSPREARRDAALEALRARPFVLTLDEQLIENLPGSSWLSAQRRALRDARRRSDARLREVDELIEGMERLQQELGQSNADPHLARLRSVQHEELALLGRIQRTREEIDRRHAAIEANLQRVRKQAELVALQSRSAALLGETQTSLPERIAAEVEVDVADLYTQVETLRRDIADEEARWAAVAEVNATQTHA